MSSTPFPTLILGPELGFAVGTRIHTREGLKPIEQVRVGDWVLTHPARTPPPHRRRTRDEILYKRVLRNSCVEVSSIVQLMVQNLADGLEDALLVATGQPVWAHGQGWQAASMLRHAQAVVLSFNGNAMLHTVQSSHQTTKVCHLTLEDGDSYYVGTLGTWVACDPEAIAPTAAVAPAKPPIDFSKAQVLLEIKNYYNDTLAEPDAPPAVPAALNPALAKKMQAAAEQLRSICKAQMQFDLGYGEPSVQWLEGYVDRMRLRQSETQWHGASVLIGAFLGECTIRDIGGQWTEHEGMHGVMLSPGNIVFPYNKVLKQFQNGTQGGDSILGFYRANKALGAAMSSQPLSAAQQRLLKHVRERHRVFVPDTSGSSPTWVQVTGEDGRFITLKAAPGQSYTTSLGLTGVNSFYVCNASGQLLHTEWIQKAAWPTLPPEILSQLKRRLSTDTALIPAQLERGLSFVEVSFGAVEPPSGSVADDVHHYTTILKNISSRRIQITRFGGFKAAEHAWQLSSVTGDYYTADDFKDWYAQPAEWLQPGESVCDKTNWGHPPVLWAYHGVTDTGESFIAGQVLEKPMGSASNPSGAHFVKPVPAQPEMTRILQKLRSSHELRQQRMNAITLASVLGPRPKWLKSDDNLTEFFDRQELLLTEGHISWGALVQANSLLFKPGDDNCPALLVHSPDEHFDARPQELRLIGHTFFSFKHTDPVDPELQVVARMVTDEMDRSMGFELPKVFSDKTVHSAIFMVFRKHLPGGVLSSGMFPILSHPSTQAVMMLPFEFWPIELIVMWKEGRL